MNIVTDKSIDWIKMINTLIKRGVSQADIARLIGLSPPSVVDIMSGRTKSVKWEVGEKLRGLYVRSSKRRG